MARRCIFCLKQYPSRDNRSFYRFPQDMDAKLEWCAALSIDPNILTETSTICCDHFSPSDILGQPGQRRSLRRNAIPLKNLKPLTELSQRNRQKSRTRSIKTRALQSIQHILQSKRFSPNCPETKISDVSTACKNDHLNVSSNEKRKLPSSTLRKEQLEFLTVVEDVDDSRISSPEIQECPQESESIESPITLPSTANAKNGLSNSNVPANGFTPVKQNVSQLFLVPARVTDPTAFIQNVPASMGKSSVILVPQTEQTANPFIQNSLLVSNNESPKIDSSTSPCEQNLVNGHSTTADPITNEELECSSSTLTASEVGDDIESSILLERAKKKKLIRYFGDISSEDMDSPPRARICLNVARRTVSNLKTKLKQLRNQNRVLKQKVESMTKLYSYLEENNYLNQYARAAIKAVLPEEADSFLTSQHEQTETEIS